MPISCTICLDPLFLLRYMSTFSYVARPICLSSLSSRILPIFPAHISYLFYAIHLSALFFTYFLSTAWLSLFFMALIPLHMEAVYLPYTPYTMWASTPFPSYIRLQSRNRRRLSGTGRPSEPALNPGNDNQPGDWPRNAKRGSDQTELGIYRG